MTAQPNIALVTIRALSKSHPLKSCPAGEQIFSAGDPGDCLYAIIEGTVSLTWRQGTHETLQPGDCFGFDVMVDPEKRRYCSARAISSVTLLPMDREHFLLAIQEFPMFALESLQVLDDRLRRVKAPESLHEEARLGRAR
ncbi:MAG: cyclic nucleotide-binding domain-containing protein [Cyanobacteriota bacterium]|nr:cyclic nucleotide-binding domain-containing protein [Cyanobacteriota bacterium]